MIDIILISFFFGIFYAGFRCGKKYSSIKEMIFKWIDDVKSFL